LVSISGVTGYEMLSKVSNERTGDSLRSLTELWTIVADILEIKIKQAAVIVEEQFCLFDLDLWIENDYTGLWKPCEGNSPTGDLLALQYMMDAWNSAESNKWSPIILQEWEILKLTPKGFQTIKEAAFEIKSRDNIEEGASLKQVVKNKVVQNEIDPSDLPMELDAANVAFRAVFNGYGDKSATFRNRLIDYLEKTFIGLNSEAVQRIATVANPDKVRGRKKAGTE
jgi:hypothetical protein